MYLGNKDSDLTQPPLRKSIRLLYGKVFTENIRLANLRGIIFYVYHAISLEFCHNTSNYG